MPTTLLREPPLTEQKRVAAPVMHESLPEEWTTKAIREILEKVRGEFGEVDATQFEDELLVILGQAKVLLSAEDGALHADYNNGAGVTAMTTWPSMRWEIFVSVRNCLQGKREMFPN